jgi:carbon storage regulator CsrA
MLVLTRRIGEQIVVPQCELTVSILDIAGGRVRIGISAPTGVTVHRKEVWRRSHPRNGREIGESLMSVRILIADRDNFLTASYREALCRHGAVVDAASNGLECMERLYDRVPDVLVLDPSLLWGGGDGVLALLQEQPALRPAYVILLTEGRNQNLLHRLSPFHVDDCQEKPLACKRLEERIFRLLASRQVAAG